MPILPDDDEPTGLRMPMGTGPQEVAPEPPSLLGGLGRVAAMANPITAAGMLARTALSSTPDPHLATLGTAFGGNTVVDAVDLMTRRPAAPVEGYNPADDEIFKGTDYERNHWYNFVGSRSPDETREIASRIDRETARHKALEAAGAWGTVAGIANDVIDPTILLPIGKVSGVGKAARAATGAFEFGAWSGAAVAMQEGVHQLAQETRSKTDSAVAIGAGTIVGGILGSAVGALTRGEVAALTRSIDQLRGNDFNGVGVGAGPVFSEVRQKLIEAGRPEAEAEGMAAIAASRYATRAQRLGDESTPLDLYRGSVSDIRSGEAGATADGRTFEQAASAPTFFSVALRSVTDAKITKGSPDQWLGTIRNTPGVKAEEMEWLGLETWLKSQGKSVTKADVEGYIRANQIEVNETTKGARGDIDPAKVEVRPLEGRTGRKLLVYDGQELGPFADYAGTPRTQDEWVTVVREHMNKIGDPYSPTKFSQYTLPGGENYRELLLTLPEQKTQKPYEQWLRENFTGVDNQQARDLYKIQLEPGANFKSSHFDEPNILAHIRFNDRVIDGKKTLFIEEVQSDWHQAGKKKGYRTDDAKDPRPELAEAERRFNEIDERHPYNGQPLNQYLESLPQADRAAYQDLSARIGEMREAAARYEASLGRSDTRVPDAPFKTTWPELSMKRMIRWAAENGYEKIAWTPGEVQAARYDLSKQISEVRWSKTTNELQAKDHSGKVVMRERVAEADLPDHIGKDVANKLVSQPTSKSPNDEIHFLSGLDLKVGGEGMLGFYDDILPSTVNKLVKKYGGRVGQGKVADVSEPIKYGDGVWAVSGRSETFPTREAAVDASATAVHTLDLTPQLREAAVEKGFPLFQGGATPQGRITFGADDKAIIELFKSANASTIIHEKAGHLWLQEMVADAARADAPQQIKDDLGIVLKWLGVDDPSKIGTKEHEKWARAQERYFAEGKAPSHALAQVFERFKEWIVSIYKSLDNISAPISDEVRGVMDRLIATDSEIAARNAGTGLPQSGGAAANVRTALTLEDTLGVDKVTKYIGPITRGQTSEFDTARAITRDFGDAGLSYKENAQGVPTSPGGTIETRITMHDAPLAQTLETVDHEFAKYWYSKPDISAMQRRTAPMRSEWARLTGSDGGKMTFKEFKEEVSKSSRRLDQHPIPEVAAVAKRGRELVLERLGKQALELGLFGDLKELGVTTAPSYLTRIYNTEMIVQLKNEWKNALINGFKANAPEAANMTDAEIRSIVDEVTANILGESDFRMPGLSIVQGPRGPLKARVLEFMNDTDPAFERFLENDYEKVLRIYNKTMSADIELARKFGSVDLKDQLLKLHDEYNAKSMALGDGPQQKALEKKYNRAKEDIEALRDRVRNVYRMPENPDGFTYRAAKVMMNINYLRLLGGMTVAAIPDIARTINAYGLTTAFRDGWLPLVTSFREARLSHREVKLAGTGLDMALDQRAYAIADLMDDFSRKTKFERVIEGASSRFGMVTLMAPWNAGIRQVMGSIVMAESLRAMEAVVKGKATKKQVEQLARAGIDDVTAGKIWAQFDGDATSAGKGTRDGVYLPNTENWTDPVATEAFRALIVREVHKWIVQPGLEKPLWTSRQLGKVIGQFKSFALSSTTRVLMANLQQRDAAALQGVLAMMALGGLSSEIGAQLRGEDTSSWSPLHRAKEAFDRSGLSGALMEINNIAEKASFGRFGLAALPGGKEVSRYQSRNVVGAVAGPSFELVGDAISTAGTVLAATSDNLTGRPKSVEWTGADTHKVRKMIATQNLSYLRKLYDKVEDSFNSAFGFKPRKAAGQ